MADEDIKIVIKQKGTIPVYTTTKMAGSDIITDETLSGKGTSSLPLKISEEIIQEIHNAGKVDDVKVDGQSVVVDKIAEIDLTGKVDKVSSADKVYGTDSQGNQTTYDVDSFGQVDDVKVNGASVVENKIANVTVPTKTSDITNDSGYITKSVDDLTNYTKTSDLASVATSGSYNDLSNTPTIGDGTLTIQKNGTTVATFTANQTGNVTANIVADQQVQADWNEADTTAPDYIKNKPTKVSDFTNDADYQNGTQVSNTVSGAINTHNTSNDAHSNLLTPITQDIDDIEALIPAQASEENKLADKNFVNSSVATNTAYFIGTFNSVEELEAYSGTLTNNDYAFVVSTDAAGNTVYDRYKYNADTQQWIFEYELNNSSFTADQWAAINSGATSEAIAQININTGTISEHIADKNNPHEVTKAQVGLGNVDNTSDLNKPISTATQTALNAKQDTLTAGTNISISGSTISATDTTYTGSDGITLTGTNFTNSGVRAIASGTANGTINVNTNGTSADVSVTGLGSAAYTSSGDYATSAQGEKADTALQPNDNISELNNDAGYTTNVGTVTSVNNVQPDANGNVTISIPSSDVTDVQIYGVSKVTSGVANLNVVEQVTSLPLSDVWMGRTVQYVGIDYPANDIYRGYYYIYETRPYGDHMSRTGWWQLNTQPQGGASSVSNLTDVELTNLTNGQTLVYNSNSSKWVNGNAGVTITYNAETEELTIS